MLNALSHLGLFGFGALLPPNSKKPKLRNSQRWCPSLIMVAPDGLSSVALLGVKNRDQVAVQAAEIARLFAPRQQLALKLFGNQIAAAGVERHAALARRRPPPGGLQRIATGGDSQRAG